MGMRTRCLDAITDVLTQFALQVKRVRTVSFDETVPAFSDVGAVGVWPFARELPLQIECRFCGVGTQDEIPRHIIRVVLFWQFFDKQLLNDRATFVAPAIRECMHADCIPASLASCVPTR